MRAKCQDGVFVWNDYGSWRGVILRLLDGLIDETVFAELKTNRPSSFAGDDLGWLDKAVEKVKGSSQHEICGRSGKRGINVARCSAPKTVKPKPCFCAPSRHTFCHISSSTRNIMKINATILSAAIVTASISADIASDISGKVTLAGTPPAEIVIKPLMDDPNCGRLLTNGPVTTRNYLVSPDNGLANTFVYVKAGLEGKKFEIPNVPEPVLNFGCLPEPYVLGVMVNQKIRIRTADAPDNLHSLSSNSPNAFNYALMSKGDSRELSFGVPELPVTLKCDVRNWAYSYIGVFDHPFFAVTDKDGSFQISGVPPGKYILEAFHRRAGKVSREITVGADNQKIDFILKVPAPR